MNAKEFLEQEEGTELIVQRYIPLMERYTNYKTRDLQASVLNYRSKLRRFIEENIIKNVLSTGETIQDFHVKEIDNNMYLKHYDEHFGVTVQKEGHI